MMNILHLLWIVPFFGVLGYLACAILSMAKEGDPDG